MTCKIYEYSSCFLGAVYEVQAYLADNCTRKLSWFLNNEGGFIKFIAVAYFPPD